MAVGLIGYRGSGKSTVGPLLARHLHAPFFDTDAMIVRRAAKSIRDIFQEQGEPAFRDLESQVVREALANSDGVIAFGGGAMDRPENRRALIPANIAMIYLRCDAAELLRRIEADPQTAAARPNLTKLAGGMDEINAVLARREPIWRAIIVAEVDVTGKSPQSVAQWIHDFLTSPPSGIR